ncbi:hypothetical protein D3C76_1408060 [compost metagenome]
MKKMACIKKIRCTIRINRSNKHRFVRMIFDNPVQHVRHSTLEFLGRHYSTHIDTKFQKQKIPILTFSQMIGNYVLAITRSAKRKI